MGPAVAYVRRSIVEKLYPCLSGPKRGVFLPYGPVIPHLGIYPEKMKSALHLHPRFTAALSTVAKIKEHPKHPPRDE